MSTNENSDAREQPRHDTPRSATIHLRPDADPISCAIVNFSQDGAELKLSTDMRLPPHFVLHVPDEGASYRAEVRWRERGQVGVGFNGKETRAKS